MTSPLGADDFFATEAGDYLGRLAALTASGSPPGADDLVRYTRALRGSALMAGQQGIARVAAGLEQVSRGYREGRRAWDVALSTLMGDSLTTLQALVQRVPAWGPEDDARAERLALQLESFAGPAARPGPSAATSQEADAGVRAFLAREAAALGSVLDQTARTIGAGPSSETLPAILRRMQPLRGMAALNDFPPLPDLLDGVERTVGSLSRLEIAPSAGRERLGAAAAALAQAARDIAERGRPNPDAEEFRRFAAALLAGAGDAMATVPIESLYFAGEDGLISRGTPGRPREALLSGAAVVSRGEHLCQTADEIAQASSAAQRDMRFHLLIEDLRTLGGGLPEVLESVLDRFGAVVRTTISEGEAARAPAAFAAVIREAGTQFRRLGEGIDPGALVQPFEQLAARLQRLAAPSVPAAAAPAPTPAPPAPPARPVTPPVVPVEALAPAPAPAPVSAPGAANGAWDLAASFGLYEEQLAREPGGLAAASPPGRISGPVSAAAPSPPAAPEVVDISELIYRGRRALERANALRREIQAARQAGGGQRLDPLVDELLDLVEMAVAD